MGDGVSWGESRRIFEHATQRTFLIHRSAGTVPGTVWMPVGRSGPIPLVLLGHGGSGDRHSDSVVSRAAWFTAAGYAAAAIDGPYHGERVAVRLTAADYQARIAAEGMGNVLDRMADDWVAAVDVLGDAGIGDGTRVAYVGLSMATRFGLAAAAGLGGGLRCAVFGKFGTRVSADLNPGLQAPGRALAAASRIAAPVLFHVQWDDEIFPRAGQLELFDAFAGSVKELHGFAGGHGVTPEHAPAIWRGFVGRHLA